MERSTAGATHRPHQVSTTSAQRAICGFSIPMVIHKRKHSQSRIAHTRKWRNGSRAGLRNLCPKGRGGSSPPSAPLMTQTAQFEFRIRTYVLHHSVFDTNSDTNWVRQHAIDGADSGFVAAWRTPDSHLVGRRRRGSPRRHLPIPRPSGSRDPAHPLVILLKGSGTDHRRGNGLNRPRERASR